MTLFLASDHRGFALKEELKAYFTERGLNVYDCGATSLDTSDDYTEFIAKAARMVAENKGARAVILGKSGQGEAMAANRFKGVRATLYYGGGTESIQFSREDNDSNILSLGASLLTTQEAIDAVELWLKTPFSGEERHVRRIAQLDTLT